MSLTTRLTWTAGLVAVAALTAACGGAAGGTSPSTSGATTTPRQAAGQGAGRAPGVSGLVAAVDGSTLQVQGSDQQTAVTWSSSTTFTTDAKATLAQVTVGSCVVVRSEQQGETTGSEDEVTATSVAIEPATDGECSGGFGRGGFGGGQRPSGAPTGGMPSGGPTGMRTGAPGGGFGGRGAFGTVTAVTGASFTVESSLPTRPGGTATTGTTTTRTVTVTVSSATSYTHQVDTTAKAAVVGTCVTALGTTDSTGALAATSIAVRQAVDGQCQGQRGQGGGSRG